MLNTLNRFCQWSSLSHWEAPSQKALEKSRLWSLIPQWWQRLQPAWDTARHNSRLNKGLPFLALLGTLLLLFLSPYAPSESNLVLIVGVALLTILRLIFVAEAPFKPGILVLVVVFYVALGLISVAASPFPRLAIHGYGKMLVYLMAYTAFVVNLRTRQHLIWAGWVIILSASIVAAYALYQYHIKVPPLALWDDPSSNFKLTRVYSFLGNPNLLGSYLLATMAVTLFYLRLVPRWGKLLVGGSLGMQMLSCYFTYSRGAWMGMAALLGTATVVWLLTNRGLLRQPRFKWGLLIVMGLGLVFMLGLLLSSPALMERLQSLFTGGEHSSNNFRMNVWNSSFAMIRDFWLLGIGTGNKIFQRIYTFYMVTGFYALSTYNVFLEIWVEMGLVGFLAFIGMLWTHLARCLAGLLTAFDSPNSLWWGMVTTALVALLVHGMVDTILFRPAVQILFWFLLAIVTINRESSHVPISTR